MASVWDLTSIEKSLSAALPQTQGPDVTVVIARDEQESIVATLSNRCFALQAFGYRSSRWTTARKIVPAPSWSLSRQGRRKGRTQSMSSIIGNCRMPGLVSRTHWRCVARANAMAAIHDGDVAFALSSELALRNGNQGRSRSFGPDADFDPQGLVPRAYRLVQALGQWAARMWKVELSQSECFFGSGAYQPAACGRARSRGRHAARLRMEVAEDVSFGWLVKRELGRRSMMRRVPTGKDRMDSGPTGNS